MKRRDFLAATGASVTSPRDSRGMPPPNLPVTGVKKMAVVTTEWRYGSHAWHMAERFLVGYPIARPLAPAAARRGRRPTSTRSPRTT